jgi:hypothetical protein
MVYPVAQVRAEGHTTSEIVIAFHLLAPPAALRLAFYQSQFQWLALTGGTYDGRRFAARPRYIYPPRTPPAQLPQIGKLLEAFGLEPLQAVAGTRDSSILHWAASIPATRRRYARFL